MYFSDQAMDYFFELVKGYNSLIKSREVIPLSSQGMRFFDHVNEYISLIQSRNRIFWSSQLMSFFDPVKGCALDPVKWYDYQVKVSNCLIQSWDAVLWSSHGIIRLNIVLIQSRGVRDAIVLIQSRGVRDVILAASKPCALYIFISWNLLLSCNVYWRDKETSS